MDRGGMGSAELTRVMAEGGSLSMLSLALARVRPVLVCDDDDAFGDGRDKSDDGRWRRASGFRRRAKRKLPDARCPTADAVCIHACAGCGATVRAEAIASAITATVLCTCFESMVPV